MPVNPHSAAHSLYAAHHALFYLLAFNPPAVLASIYHLLSDAAVSTTLAAAEAASTAVPPRTLPPIPLQALHSLVGGSPLCMSSSPPL